MNRPASTPDTDTRDAGSRPGLTERYVHAVVRDLPEDRRDDLARELRSTIADMVEAGTTTGTSSYDAERAALVQLGHPALLASSYATGPQFLIGPRFYAIWKRLVRNLLLWVPALAATLAMVLELTDRVDDVGQVVVAGLAGAWGAAVQVVLWPTLVFAILERTTDSDATDVLAWDPDQLPDVTVHQRGIPLGEAVAGATFSLVVAALLVLQHELTWIGPDSRTALLDPDLWSGWLPFLVVVLVAGAALELWKYRVGWTMSVLAATVVTSAAFSVPVALLAQRDMLLNPEFVDALSMTPSALDGTNTVVALVALGVMVWEIGEALYRTVVDGRRANAA